MPFEKTTSKNIYIKFNWLKWLATAEIHPHLAGWQVLVSSSAQEGKPSAGGTSSMTEQTGGLDSSNILPILQLFKVTFFFYYFLHQSRSTNPTADVTGSCRILKLIKTCLLLSLSVHTKASMCSSLPVKNSVRPLVCVLVPV